MGPGPDQRARVLLCAPDRAERTLVVAALTERGVPPVVLDPASFPGGNRLTFDPGGTGDTSFTAAWTVLAELVGADLPPLDPDERDTCVAAAEILLLAWLEQNCGYQLDPQWTQQRADNKPVQLARARAAGLDVPATLISNDPVAVRAFAAGQAATVAKMLVQPRGDAGVVFTTTLDEAELADLSGLELCPMIFQERVVSAGDVRATVIGTRVISALLASSGATDWRQQAYAHDDLPAWSDHELPPKLRTQLTELTASLGLGYGAVDLIRRPDGGYTFLELNATGSFAFLGDEIAARIADAIADQLTSKGRTP